MNFEICKMDYITGELFFDGDYFYFPSDKEKINLHRVIDVRFESSGYDDSQ